MTVGDAAAAADVDTAAASRALKTLKDLDLVRPQTTNSRGRATIVFLTPAGEALRTELEAINDDRAAKILAGFSPDEVEMFNEMLGRILDNVERLPTDAGLEAAE